MTTTRKGLRAQELVLCGIFSALIAVGAFLRVPVPLVPFTLQLFFVTMAGFVLGPRLGAVSALVYVALGLAGLPVFTMGGGLGYVFQPSFGFLLGLIPAAWVIGRLAGEGTQARRIVPACLAGLGVLYLVGLPYMYLILNVYLDKGLSIWYVVRAGMLIYLPGDFLKIAVTTLLARPLKRALSH